MKEAARVLMFQTVTEQEYKNILENIHYLPESPRKIESSLQRYLFFYYQHKEETQGDAKAIAEHLDKRLPLFQFIPLRDCTMGEWRRKAKKKLRNDIAFLSKSNRLRSLLKIHLTEARQMGHSQMNIYKVRTAFQCHTFKKQRSNMQRCRRQMGQ